MIKKIRSAGVVAVTLLLSACANVSERAPQSAHRPWTPPPASAQWQQLAIDGTPAASTTLAPLASVDLAHIYDLPELVNMAQLNNPITRVAWSQARQAASAIGLVEATYLPMLSANVIGGRAAMRHRFPEVLDDRIRLKSSVSGYAGLLGFEWLLYDFGARASASEAASNLSLVANFTFNAIHQQLAFNVTSAYYAYGAARHHSEIAAEALTNGQKIQDAVLARSKSGLATSVELAQARQLVAQARLQQATANGAQRNAYQTLLLHLGIPFDTPLKVEDSAKVPLPSQQTLPEGTILRRALADRPDILASIASLKAAENAVDVARASFFPKIFLAGFTAAGSNDLSIGPIGGLSNSGASRAILVGMSLPIYDGGIRSTHVHEARERVDAAQASLDKLRSAALSEMVIASNLLENALASHDAATELVDTTSFTYQAALDTYKEGLGTITVATEASTLLLTARGAQADAHAAALTAAAALALSLGQLDVGDPRSTVH